MRHKLYHIIQLCLSKINSFAKGIFYRYKNLSLRHRWLARGIIIAVLLAIAALIYLIIQLNQPKVIYFSDSNIKISEDTQKTDLAEQDEGSYSIKVPQDWKVATTGQGVNLVVYAYNPDDSRFQIFIQLQSKPLMRTYDERNIYQRYANTDSAKYGVYAYAPVIRLGTTESFYDVFNDYTDNIQSYLPEYADFHFPKLTSFAKQVSSANKTTLTTSAKDDTTVRATFSNAANTAEITDNTRAEGLFTGTVVSYSPSDVSGYYVVYGTAFITAPEDSLIAYEPTLIEALKSIKLKDEFLQTISGDTNWDEHAPDANTEVQEAADSIAKAWDSRSSDYDTTRQKYADNKLGYERVCDTETGKLYRAFKGFVAGYTGSRYRAATDKEYTTPISGYISYISTDNK